MDSSLIPHAALSFFALIMGIISLWVYRSPWIYGSFFLISYFLGSLAKIVEPIALIPLAALLIIHTFLKADVKGTARALLVVAATLLSLALWLHLVPGFHKWKISQQFAYTEGSIPFTFSLNWDKPFTGIFILGWSFPLLRTKEEIKKLCRSALPFAIVSVIVLILLAVSLNLVRWDPKLPTYFWLFSIANLFLTVIPEEALIRGFVQSEFFRWFGGKGSLANSGSVLITSVLFALLHIRMIQSPAYIFLVFVAGIFYGSIYQYTKSIESSIFCHYLLNMVHVLLFSYPALSGQHP